MGREAKCRCKWGDEEADCKVLLEGSELIFRLGMRRRVPTSSMKKVSAQGAALVFRVGQDQVALQLGPEVAQRWAKAIATPPPTLASKLGISSATKLRVVGHLQSDELKAAIAEAGAVGGRDANLILVCSTKQQEIDVALHQLLGNEGYSGPLWIVYPKGPSGEVKESLLRVLLRTHGFVDTKVASVSAKLTAIRFVKRKEK